jgi:hypothetical protein
MEKCCFKQKKMSLLNMNIIKKPGIELYFMQVITVKYVVQTGSEAHPTSYPMGTERSSAGGKAAWATHFQLVPRSRKRGSVRPLPHTS